MPNAGEFPQLLAYIRSWQFNLVEPAVPAAAPAATPVEAPKPEATPEVKPEAVGKLRESQNGVVGII